MLPGQACRVLAGGAGPVWRSGPPQSPSMAPGPGARSPRKRDRRFAVVMAQLLRSPYSSIALLMVVDSLIYSISSSSVRSTPWPAASRQRALGVGEQGVLGSKRRVWGAARVGSRARGEQSALGICACADTARAVAATQMGCMRKSAKGRMHPRSVVAALGQAQPRQQPQPRAHLRVEHVEPAVGDRADRIVALCQAGAGEELAEHLRLEQLDQLQLAAALQAQTGGSGAREARAAGRASAHAHACAQLRVCWASRGSPSRWRLHQQVGEAGPQGVRTHAFMHTGRQQGTAQHSTPPARALISKPLSSARLPSSLNTAYRFLISLPSSLLAGRIIAWPAGRAGRRSQGTDCKARGGASAGAGTSRWPRVSDGAARAAGQLRSAEQQLSYTMQAR